MDPSKLFTFKQQQDQLDALEKSWKREMSRDVPDYSVELSLAEALLERGKAEQALEHFEDLARDGFGEPQLLCLRLAESSLRVGEFRKARQYLSRCFQLPRGDDSGEMESRALELVRVLEGIVLERGVGGIKFCLLTALFVGVGVFARSRRTL